MCLELGPNARKAHGMKVCAQAFSSRKTHRRHNVRIASDHHDSLHQTLQRQGRHVEANSHVHALLHNVGNKTMIRKACGRICFYRSQGRFAEPPAPHPDFAPADCKISRLFKALLQ